MIVVSRCEIAAGPKSLFILPVLIFVVDVEFCRQ